MHFLKLMRCNKIILHICCACISYDNLFFKHNERHSRNRTIVQHRKCCCFTRNKMISLSSTSLKHKSSWSMCVLRFVKIYIIIWLLPPSSMFLRSNLMHSLSCICPFLSSCTLMHQCVFLYFKASILLTLLHYSNIKIIFANI